MADHSSPDRVASRVYSRSALGLISLCFVLSGATGLIYEVLWARMLGLVFGGSTLAVSTVLSAFMGGLALGSALAGRSGERLQRPLRSYGLIEIAIAAYALSVPLLFRMVDNGYALIWQQLHPGFYAFSMWRFILSGATLLVPTTLMGATLPVLAAALLRNPTFKSTSVARLYTCNLVGAIGGVIAAGFFLLPAIGQRKTIYAAAAINVLIGAVALIIDSVSARNARPSLSSEESQNADGVTTRKDSFEIEANAEHQPEDLRFWLCCAFVSGFVTIGSQVAWTRILTMVIGSSTYAFSLVVALFLIGLSAGAVSIAAKKSWQKLRLMLFVLELLTALSLWLSLRIMNQTPGLVVNLGLRLHIDTWRGLLLLQILSAALLILIPGFLMGTVMPLVLVWAGKAQSTRLVGRSYAVNTLGAIAGAFCAGFILIPRVGTRFTIIIAAALCLIIAGLAFPALSFIKDRDLGRALSVGTSVALLILLFVSAPVMNLNDLSIGAYDSLVRVLAKSRTGINDDDKAATGPEIHQLLMYEEGPTATVSVRKDWNITSLAINGRTNASDSEDMSTQVMLAQLPLLLAPRINNGLIVGFASGVSAGAILQSPIESVTCVELEPATIDASRFFEHVNHHPLNDPRLHLVIDDARTFLRVNQTRYDIIMSEPSHPWVPGVANLFTEEFFRVGSDRLNDDGVFVQWLQIYQLSTSSLRSVLATFHKVFPHVMIFRVSGTSKGKDLIIAGSRTALTMDRIGERLRDPRIAAEMARVGLKSEADVRAWYVCEEKTLGPAVAGAIINTDDNMHVETTAPREAFLPSTQTNAAWIEALAQSGQNRER